MTTTLPQKAGHSLPPVQAYQPRPAGFFSRMEAFIIDLIIISLVQLTLTAIFETLLRFFRFVELARVISLMLENSVIKLTIGALVFNLFILSYFIFFWTLVGYTPGKAVLSLRVVRLNGAPLSFGRSLLRFLAYWLSALPFFLGFLWVLWDPKRQGWHDKLTQTQVLYYPKKPPTAVHP